MGADATARDRGGLVALLAAAMATLAVAGGGAALLVLRAGPLPGGMPPPAAIPAGRAELPATLALVERSGRRITRDDLRGRVWVVAFIFTRCMGPCPKVTDHMAGLRRTLTDPGIGFLSITVDPDFDDPQTLAAYATQHGADPDWWFVTGPKADLRHLIRDTFQLTADDAAGDDRRAGFEVVHSTRIAFVDRAGRVRGYVDGTESNEVALVPAKVAALLAEPADAR
jgi:cytochrome oxidase Cu insertion factor (SCO1/SenC/PrrC family)